LRGRDRQSPRASLPAASHKKAACPALLRLKGFLVETAVTFAVHVFDAYGTLLDVHSAVARCREALGAQADRLSDLWRTKQLEYAWTRSLMGAYRDFAALTEEALDFAAARCGGVSEGTRAKLLEAYQSLDAYPDAAPALRRLRENGSTCVILSNGAPRELARAVESAGLAGFLDESLSVDPLRIFKTAPQAYDLVLRRYGVAPREVAFQSSNRWDIAGAKKFGFCAHWINRADAPDEYRDLPPDRVLSSLAEL
jgi:2-haloacid dehalogenase